MWNHTAGTLGRSMRATHGVLVEHQRVLVTVESPRRAYQAVQRMTRSKTQRELWQVNAEHRDMSFNARGLYRLWPGGQSAGFLMRFSFLHTRTLEADDRPPPQNVFAYFPPRQAPRALSPRAPRGPKKNCRCPWSVHGCCLIRGAQTGVTQRHAGHQRALPCWHKRAAPPPPHTHPSIKKHYRHNRHTVTPRPPPARPHQRSH